MRGMKHVGVVGLIVALAGSVPAVSCFSRQPQETHSCCSLPSDEAFSQAPCCAALTCATPVERNAVEPATAAPSHAPSDGLVPIPDAAFGWATISAERRPVPVHFPSPTFASLRTVVLIL